MTGNPKKMTALAVVSALAWVALQAPATAAPGYGPPKVPKKPMLKQLTPTLDLSNEPDPGELFESAVREYAAGHMPKAEKLFEKVVELDPLNADAHFNLGAIKEWRNDWASALQHYCTALRAKPKDKEIAEAVRAVEYKLKHRTAIEAQMAKQRVEQDMALRSRMAKEAFASQNYEEAVVQLNYLAQATPEDAKIQFALGQSLRALRSYDWAAYRLKMAIYLDPENDLYRKTLVDLDNEIQQTSSQTIGETMDKMLIQMSRSDMAHIGLVNEY